MKRYLALLAALVTHQAAAPAQEPHKPLTQQEIWQGQLYDSLGDMILARDELIAEGYAVVIEGIKVDSHTTFIDNGVAPSPFVGAPKVEPKPAKLVTVDVPDEKPFIAIYARKGPSQDYRAEFRVFPARPWAKNHQGQSWSEIQTRGAEGADRTRYMFYGDPIWKTPTWYYRQGMSFVEWLKTPIRADDPASRKPGVGTDAVTPYDCFFAPVGLRATVSSKWHPSSIENYLFKFDFQRVEPIPGDMMRSTWTSQGRGWKFETTIDHQRQRDWMPAESRYKSTERPKGWEKVDGGEYLQLFEWKERKAKTDASRSFWLPGWVEHGSNHNANAKRPIRVYAKLTWLIGSDVPRDVFDTEAADPRADILDKVGIDFMRIGEDGFLLPPPHYKPPAELIERFAR